MKKSMFFVDFKDSGVDGFICETKKRGDVHLSLDDVCKSFSVRSVQPECPKEAGGTRTEFLKLFYSTTPSGLPPERELWSCRGLNVYAKKMPNTNAENGNAGNAGNADKGIKLCIELVVNGDDVSFPQVIGFGLTEEQGQIIPLPYADFHDLLTAKIKDKSLEVIHFTEIADLIY